MLLIHSGSSALFITFSLMLTPPKRVNSLWLARVDKSSFQQTDREPVTLDLEDHHTKNIKYHINGLMVECFHDPHKKYKKTGVMFYNNFSTY